MADQSAAQPQRETVDIQKYPWSSVGKIGAAGYSSGEQCTGAVIGPNQFLTAAHCLYNRSTRTFMQPGSLHILLGYEKGEYRVHRVGSHYTIPPAFDPTLYSGAANRNAIRTAASHDWTVVYTSEPFPPDVRPLRVAIAAPPRGTNVKIGGYAIERRHMMTADLHCRITTLSLDEKLIAHDCVGHHGDSGAPLLNADDEGLILGVHVLGFSLLVELQEQSKKGGWAVSSESIMQFLGSQPLDH